MERSMSRKEELSQVITEKVSQFKVRDIIAFNLEDDSFCTESNGDAISFEIQGKILQIDGHTAIVEHKYGVCNVWLPIAKKIYNNDS